eukprot:XP_022282217.1 basic proline-rich protein-like [Canis lupus familiaris]
MPVPTGGGAWCRPAWSWPGAHSQPMSREPYKCPQGRPYLSNPWGARAKAATAASQKPLPPGSDRRPGGQLTVSDGSSWPHPDRPCPAIERKQPPWRWPPAAHGLTVQPGQHRPPSQHSKEKLDLEPVSGPLRSPPPSSPSPFPPQVQPPPPPGPVTPRGGGQGPSGPEALRPCSRSQRTDRRKDDGAEVPVAWTAGDTPPAPLLLSSGGCGPWDGEALPGRAGPAAQEGLAGPHGPPPSARPPKASNLPRAGRGAGRAEGGRHADPGGGAVGAAAVRGARRRRAAAE